MTDLVRIENSNTGLILRTFEEIETFSQRIVKSGMAPKGVTADQIAVRIAFGKEVGLGIMSSIKNIASVNGIPSIWGDAAMALVWSSGLLVKHEEGVEGKPFEPDYSGYCVVQRKGHDERKFVYTVREATIQGLWGKPGPWKQVPDRMLKLRARGYALRDVFADVLNGLVIHEIAVDDDGPTVEVKDVTPRSKDVLAKLGEAEIIEATVSDVTLDEIAYACEEFTNAGGSVDKLLAHFKLTSPDQLTREMVDRMLEKVRGRSIGKTDHEHEQHVGTS